MIEQLISLYSYVVSTLKWTILLPLIAVELVLVITLACIVVKMVMKRFRRKGE